MKESEQKSVSEARGYVPMVTPQQAMLVVKNLPPIPAGSTSSSSSSAAGGQVSNGPTGSVVNVPSKATPTKDKDAGATKSVESGESLAIIMV